MNILEKINENDLVNKFEIVFNYADAAFVVDTNGIVLKCNDKTELLYQYKKDDLTGRMISDILSPDSQQYFLDNLKKLRELKTVSEEIEIVKKDGSIIIVDRESFPLENREGVFSGSIILDKDVTDNIRDKENLALQDIALQASDNGIVITNKDSAIVWINSAFTKITGYSKDDLIYKKTSVLNSGKHDNEFFENMWKTILAGEIWSGEIVNRRKDESCYTEFQVITPVFNSKNEINFFISIKNDITEEKKAREREKIHQEQLIQADKMVALGTLVSGVAHEINNPNNFIMLNVPIMRKTWESVAPILDKHYEVNGDFFIGNRLKFSKIRESFPILLEGIEDGARRIKRIVEELKDFARHNPEKNFKEVKINDIINAAIMLINNTIKKATNNFRLELKDDIPFVNCNYQQIEQVVINLIQNSCHSLKDKNKAITVKTDYNKESKLVEIIVEDEGCGIDRSNIKKITDPFFTTKRDYGGTGLGLSVSKKIIMNHNGTLEFDSEIGVGTKAIINIPLEPNK
ncbi:MAG: PAS domain S-box protein [Melioribacteraceae bacterium]|nr:PAS domain S-box protein [Melioribacteraceae bacterium]